MRIELLWKYIHYDVDQLTWRYAKTHTTDEENKEIGQTSVGDSDSNLIKRFAITGTARLRRILNDYISAKNEDADDTLPLDKKKWGFNFNSDITADGHALAELMHWFVVRFCIFHWCKMFAPDQALLEKAELDDIKKDLEKLLDGDSSMPIKEHLVISPDDEYDDSIIITYEPSM